MPTSREGLMHRTSSGGTYRLDRTFPGVGRIAKASGATTRAEFHNRDALLTRLYNQGRLDLLRAIQAGTYSMTEVYAGSRATARAPDRRAGDPQPAAMARGGGVDR